MTLAEASLRAGNYRAALGYAREVLSLDADHARAVEIQNRATQMLSRFDDEVGEARRRLARGDLEGAARAIDQARGIDPTSPLIPELSARLTEAFRARDNSRASAQPRVTEESKQALAAEPTPPRVQSAPGTLPPPPPPSSVPAVAAAPPAPTPPVVARPVEPPRPDPAPVTTIAPSVKEAPAVAKPATPPPATENDDTLIRQVIATYGRAIENKDIRLFRSIKPNLTREEERRLQDGFRAVTSQRVNLTVVSIDRADNRATVVVRRRDDIEAGGRRHTTDAQQSLSLVRGASGWVIADIR
jgi:hypothetical protein